MKNIIFFITSLLCSGCMHTMMMSSHDEPQAQTIIVHEREVSAGDIKAVASFPPFELDKEVIVTVKLSDKETSSPISEAKIVGHVTFRDQRENAELKATKSGPGTYNLSFTPLQTGEYSVKIEVLSIQSHILDQPIVIIESGDVILENHKNHQGNMHDSGNLPSMMIIGGIVMTTMMLGMLLWRGGIF